MASHTPHTHRMHCITHALNTPHCITHASHAHAPFTARKHACSSLAHIQAPEQMCVFEGGRVEGARRETRSRCGRDRFQPTTPPGDPRLPQRVWGATQRMLARKERRRQTEGKCK